MNENLKRHRPDIKVLGEGKAIAFMPEDPMGVWVHIQEVRDLLDVKDRTIRDYEDNYLPRPKTMELKSWMIGSPETGEQGVYDAEEVDRVLAAKNKEMEDLKKKLASYEDCAINAGAERDANQTAIDELNAENAAYEKKVKFLDEQVAARDRIIKDLTAERSTLRKKTKRVSLSVPKNVCIECGKPVTPGTMQDGHMCMTCYEKRWSFCR